MSDVVRVLRIVEYVGERAWVEDQVARSIHGVKKLRHGEIRVATITVTTVNTSTEAVLAFGGRKET